jgi:hypothetical protein
MMIGEMTLEKYVFAYAKHGPNIPNNGGEKILNYIMSQP